MEFECLALYRQELLPTHLLSNCIFLTGKLQEVITNFCEGRSVYIICVLFTLHKPVLYRIQTLIPILVTKTLCGGCKYHHFIMEKIACVCARACVWGWGFINLPKAKYFSKLSNFESVRDITRLKFGC